MKSKYPNKIAKAKFSEVMLENGVWTLRIEVEMRTGVLAAATRILVLKIDPDTTNVVGYSESAPPKA